MKISVDIDCTPQELRRFFGLPDVESLQADMITRMKDQMDKGLSPQDMERLMKNWMTGAASGMEQFQAMFQAALSGGGGKADK